MREEVVYREASHIKVRMISKDLDEGGTKEKENQLKKEHGM